MLFLVHLLQEDDEKETGNDLPNLPDYSELQSVPGSDLSETEADSFLTDYSNFIPETVYNSSEQFTDILDGFYDFTFDYYFETFSNFYNQTGSATIIVSNLVRIRSEEKANSYNLYYDIRNDTTSNFTTILTTVCSKNFRSAYIELDYYALQSLGGSTNFSQDSKYRSNIRLYSDRIETNFANKIAFDSNNGGNIVHYAYGSSTINKDKSGKLDFFFYSFGLGKFEACKEWNSSGSVTDCVK